MTEAQKLVKKLMETPGWTGRYIERRVGASRGCAGRWLAGKQPRVATLEKLRKLAEGNHRAPHKRRTRRKRVAGSGRVCRVCKGTGRLEREGSLLVEAILAAGRTRLKELVDATN